MFCFKCGNQLVEGAAFCQKCGAKQNTDESIHQTTDNTDSKSADNTTSGKSEVILGSIGNAIVSKGLAVYNRNLDLTYYVKKDISGAKIIAETKGAKREIFIDKSNAPKNLFTDESNLYFLLQEGSKLFKKNPVFIYACPHGSSVFSKLGTVEAKQIFCYGENLYYVAPTKDSHIFKIRKDGSGNEIFIAKNAWDDISVYNDKLYFRDADKKNQLVCVNLDGQNLAEVGGKKTSDYFISNDVIYHTVTSMTTNKLSYYKMRDGSTGTTPGFDGVVLNIVDGFAFTYPVNTEKLQNHPLARYDIKNNTVIKYENVPAVKNFALDRPTVNVANGMIYFGNNSGIIGRISVDGGTFESL